MEDIVHAVLFIAVAGVVFLTVIIIDAVMSHRAGKPPVYSIPETLTNMAMGVNYKIVDGIAVAIFIRVFFDWVHQFGLQYEPDDGIWSVLLIVVVVDLAWYCLHVMTHKIRWFWASHITHHSSQRMNYSTALRQNFTMAFNGIWMVQWIPVALIGFDKDWATIAIELNLAYQFFLHTENKSPLDRFGWILNTPSHHRVHHGNQEKQIDTNFGGVLIIWDKLFGTFVAERDAGPIRYGVTLNQPQSLNPLYLQLHEWHAMYRDYKKVRSIKVFLKGPGWVNAREKSR